MFTIKLKIVLAYTIVFGIMLTIFAGIIYNSTKETAFMKLNANLKSYSISLQTEIEEQLDENFIIDYKKLNSIRSKGLIRERFQLFDKKGKSIISDSILPEISPSQIDKILNETIEYESQKINHHKYQILWSTFESENDSVYILETASSVKDVYEELDRLLFLFLIIIPAGLIITGIAAYFISKAAFKPITRMMDIAKNISGKNLDKRLELPKAKDEIRALGETLNAMIVRIDSAFKSQKRFVANASHEIRTPLTVIQTELEILEKKIKENEDKESIKIVLAEIDDLTKLTNSLLLIAKLDSAETKLNLSQTRIDELLLECVQAMNREAVKKNIQIKLSIEDAIEINADKEKLKSVFLNLIDNAVKYSKQSSQVNVSLQRQTSGKIIVEVENNGPGIPPQEFPHIFNRFYRSNEIKAEISGSGLGLAIAKEIVELHRGEISVESIPGEKTVFYVILPLNNI